LPFQGTVTILSGGHIQGVAQTSAALVQAEAVQGSAGDTIRKKIMHNLAPSAEAAIIHDYTAMQ